MDNSMDNYMDNSMDNLDLSWTDEYYRTTEGGKTYEPELMNEITLKLIYTNMDDEIFHTIDKKIALTINNENDHSILSEERLIEIIQKNRNFQNKRYKCDSIIRYFNDMDPETIIDNIEDEDFQFDSDKYFSHFEIPKTLSFPPSLFIFHSINSIYIIFREMVLVNPINSPVSIIKKYKNKVTKRVRISDHLPSYSTTRKSRK